MSQNISSVSIRRTCGCYGDYLRHQQARRAGIYQSRTRAAHCDGRNDIGEPVASGVCFYTLKAGDFSATRKMLILK